MWPPFRPIRRPRTEKPAVCYFGQRIGRGVTAALPGDLVGHRAVADGDGRVRYIFSLMPAFSSHQFTG